jgi:hypothetical protein
MAKRKEVPMRAIFDNVKDLTVQKISGSEVFVQMLKIQVPEKIEEAFKSKNEVATIFEINASSHFIDIPKSEWVKALETCLIWYGKEEDYKTCIKLRDLIVEIKKTIEHGA